MTQDITADDGRTDSKRFDADATFDASDLIVGDRIDPSLVANTMDALGERRSPAPDANEMQLAEATITNRMDDVHNAILVDGETGVMVRATRHDSQSAWSQKEADWKVREIGTKASITDAEIEEDGNDEWSDADADTAAEEWANIVLQDRARGSTDYHDELTMSGRNVLTLYEPYAPTKVHANIGLVDE